MSWKEGESLPYDGWYDGNVKLMMLNGTYADFRPALEKKASLGKMATQGTIEERIQKSMVKLEAYDKQWEAIPLETRIARRTRVAEDSAVREIVVHTARGPMKVLRRTPSKNNEFDDQKKAMKKNLPQRLPTGSITKDNSPLSLSLSPA